MYQIQTLKSEIYNIVITNLSNVNLNGAFIAAQLGVNRMYVHRKLVDLHQQNARDYIRTIRIKKAKELLRNTNTSVQKIAIMIGYKDASFFTKNFKKEVGITPSNYRKQET